MPGAARTRIIPVRKQEREHIPRQPSPPMTIRTRTDVCRVVRETEAAEVEDEAEVRSRAEEEVEDAEAEEVEANPTETREAA